jgi:hypothetical protein
MLYNKDEMILYSSSALSNLETKKRKRERERVKDEHKLV